jgi:thermitase
MSIRSLACAAVLFGFALPSVTWGQTSPEVSGYGYYYFKAWRPLPLDAAHVAVQSESIAGVTTALKAVRVDPGAAREWPVAGWWIVDLEKSAAQREAGAGEGARIEALVNALAAQPTLRFAAPVFVGQGMGPMWPTADVIGGFAAGLGPVERDAIMQVNKLLGQDGKVKDHDWMPGVDRVTVGTHNGLEVIAMANALARAGQVLFAEPDFVFTAKHDIIPNDPQFADQWGLANSGQNAGRFDMDVGAAEAWNITTGSSLVVVAILDDGIELTHPDLNVASQNQDFTGQGTGGLPGNICDNHGTAVAGCVAARMNNGIGVAGVAPGCRVASARVGISTTPCSDDWTSQSSWVVNALNWAMSSGCSVTNCSFGMPGPLAAVDTAFTNTHNGGLVHFAASGNYNGAGSISYPASSPSVNAVGAIDRYGLKANFSQWGTGLKFSAPGKLLATTDRMGANGYDPGDTTIASGTSLASPYAAGVAALIRSRFPSYTAAQVESLMYSTCKDLGAPGYDTTFGYGIPDAFAAMGGTSGPPNDFCTRAIDVSAQGTFAGTLVGATYTPSETTGACGSAASNPDVWYAFTNPLWTRGTLRVTTCGTNDMGGTDAGIDTVLSIHSTCGAPAIDCNDDWTVGATTAGCAGMDNGSARDSAVSASVGTWLDLHQTVLIRVSKYGGSPVGPFTLHVTFTPEDDACGSATDISEIAESAFPMYYYNTLVGATNDGGTACGNSFTTPDVWYRFTAPRAGRLAVNTCGTNDFDADDTGVDTVLSVHAVCGGPALACNDDWPGVIAHCHDAGQQRDSALLRAMSPGETVLVRLSRYQNSIDGPTTLTASFQPLNDNCADAIAVSNGITPFDTRGATTDGPSLPTCNFCCNDTIIAHEVWYRYTATCNGPVSISTCGSIFNTKLAVFNGWSCSNATPATCNDDSVCGQQAAVAFPATAGQQFLIQLGGYWGAMGQGVLTIVCAGCGSADFNCDGDIGTDSDIEAFFACLAGSCPAAPCTSSADFNGDGDIGTDADIESFFRVLGGGAC